MYTYEETKKSEALESEVLKINFIGCPVQASLGVLGKKWSLLIIRNIALYGKNRFNDMLRITPGLTRRVLSMRLRELEDEGYIEVVQKSVNYSRWDLTEKGEDVLPVLMSLVRLGAKWYPGSVFTDGLPRKLEDVFQEEYIRKIMRV